MESGVRWGMEELVRREWRGKGDRREAYDDLHVGVMRPHCAYQSCEGFDDIGYRL
jgi:predicted GNAT superfamily acetyltransferase